MSTLSSHFTHLLKPSHSVHLQPTTLGGKVGVLGQSRACGTLRLAPSAGGAHWLCPWWLQLVWLKTCLLNVPNNQKCQICLCVWRYFPNRPHGALLVLATKKSGWSCRSGLSQHSCKWCVWPGQLHTTVTGGKRSDEHNPMPSNPAGWSFKYDLSLYISEGYVRYSKYFGYTGAFWERNRNLVLWLCCNDWSETQIRWQVVRDKSSSWLL